MLGAIIGDVVGSVYEFDNTKDYNFKMFSSGSSFTDDSILTVAVAEWAMKDKTFSLTTLEESLVDFGNRHYDPIGGYGYRMELWLHNPERLVDYATNLPSKGRCPYHSFGNGSAMRVSSVGWLFDTLEETERVAALSASITHNHREGIKGAQAVASAIFMARNGSSKEDIRSYIEHRFHYNLKDSWEYLHDTYSWRDSCQETVPQAIIAFLESTDYEDAIRKAISMGGDSDTIGCITGGIAEAYYQHIPLYMVQKVMQLLKPDLKDAVVRLAKNSYYKECFDAYISFSVAPTVFTPDNITSLKDNEVFVFGSNLKGMHAGGAANYAFLHFGAEWGVGVGMAGQTYAIPTMQGGVETVKPYVDEFLQFAETHPELKFYVTRIGCGIAGFTDAEIAPLFKKAVLIHNIVLPESFYNQILLTN